LPQKASVLPHQVDHIVAQQHSGSDRESNLCLCCLRCNLKKGPNIASRDPEAANENNLVALFHPRQQHWHDNFQLHDDGYIFGTSPAGRATARLLDFNEEDRVVLMRVLMRQGWRP
jgi:hypothetical protein